MSQNDVARRESGRSVSNVRLSSYILLDMIKKLL